MLSSGSSRFELESITIDGAADWKLERKNVSPPSCFVSAAQFAEGHCDLGNRPQLAADSSYLCILSDTVWSDPYALLVSKDPIVLSAQVSLSSSQSLKTFKGDHKLASRSS